MINLKAKKKINSVEELEQQALKQLSSITGFLKQHPTFSIASFYLAISTLGLFYIFSLSRLFNINILPHLEISDYILAPIHYPLIILLFLIMAGGAWLGYTIEKKLRKYKKVENALNKANKPFYYLNPLFTYTAAAFAVIFYVIYVSSDLTHQDIIKQKNQAYTLSFAAITELNKEPITHLEKVQIIADTVKYLWVYDEHQNIHAIPQKNIASLIPIKESKDKDSK